MLADWQVEPVCIGPTWQRDPDWDGVDVLSKYVLPQWTLGWQILDWIESNLLGDDGEPFCATPEQKRFILWWYAIDEDGRFIYRDGVLQRLKGWGKDPLVAVICAVELIGPCRFAGWATEDMPALGVVRGEPVAKECTNAWIDVAAVSKEQTINTMSIFPSLFSEACKKSHGITKQSLGKEIIYAHGGRRRIRAVTSNPRSLEGGRATFVVRNETHHWLESNNGHEMASVIGRNASKSKGGRSRALSITNAYEPSENSFAQIQREAWEAEQAEMSIDTHVLYDSLEIPGHIGTLPPKKNEDDPPPDEAEIRAWLTIVLTAVRGDAWWLDIPTLQDSILSKENTPAKSRRFWFNQISAAEDAWINPSAPAAGIHPLAKSEREKIASADPFAHLVAGWIVGPKEPIVAFFDGSKSDDSTVIVGCRLTDGYTFVIGLWAKPTGELIKGWRVNRAQVDYRVDEMMERFNVVAFWADPSHALDDDGTRYWDGIIDGWHQRYNDRFQLWSIKTGNKQHSVMWDMTSPERLSMFVTAAEMTHDEIEMRDEATGAWAPPWLHDGHPALMKHWINTRRWPTLLVGGRTGISVHKESRESAKKIDLTVGTIGAHMLRRLMNNVGYEPPKKRGGWAVAL
jgi:hypothetical protein